MNQVAINLLKRFVEVHSTLPRQHEVLLASTKMLIDLYENNPMPRKAEDSELKQMFEIWCMKNNFSVEKYVHPTTKAESFNDSKTRRAWYAVRDIHGHLKEL